MAFSDNFNRADEQLDASADWETPSNVSEFSIVSNKVNGTGDALARVATATEAFGDDQEAECVISALGVGDFAGPAVRLDADGDGYAIDWASHNTVGKLVFAWPRTHAALLELMAKT